MAEASSTSVEVGPRARTRRAILDAAVDVLSKKHAASLGDIAAAAGVGRTTIHRYYPERSDLLGAVGNDVLERIQQATIRARADEETPLAALRRLVQEYFELGDSLMLVLEIPQLMTGPEWQEETEFDRSLGRLVERGHADGSIDPGISSEWAVQILWSLLYAGWIHAREQGTPKHAALDLCLHSLEKVFRATPS